MKSFGASPSIGFPSLSLTLTVCTISRVVLRNVAAGGCCAAVAQPRLHRPPERRPRHDKLPSHKDREDHKEASESLRALGELRGSVARSSSSESKPHRALDFPRRICEAWQPELRAADDVVHAGVRLEVQHVGEVQPPVEAQTLCPLKRARDGGAEVELRGTNGGVAARGPPLPRRRRSVSIRIQIVAVRGRRCRACQARAQRSGDARSR